MKTFTISAINSSREFEGNDLDTVISVLSHAATRSFFGFDPSDSQDAINEALSTLVPHVDTVISGNKGMSLKQMPDNFRDAILNAVLEDGAQIEIEYYAAEDDDANEVKQDELAHEAAGGDETYPDGFDPTAASGELWTKDPVPSAGAEPVEPPQGTAGPKKHGMVTVSTNGGMVSTKIEIEDGVTTIRTVIYNPVVLNRAGMDETAMSNCMVSLNGDIISPNNIGIRKLHAGDTLDIVPRFASKLGAE